MMEVSLYIEVSSKRIKPGKASFCYVLEYISPAGNTYTKSEIGCMEASGKRLVLSAVVRALGHLKPGCRVTIHTDLRYLESALMLDKYYSAPYNYDIEKAHKKALSDFKKECGIEWKELM